MAITFEDRFAWVLLGTTTISWSLLVFVPSAPNSVEVMNSSFGTGNIGGWTSGCCEPSAAMVVWLEDMCEIDKRLEPADKRDLET